MNTKSIILHWSKWFFGWVLPVVSDYMVCFFYFDVIVVWLSSGNSRPVVSSMFFNHHKTQFVCVCKRYFEFICFWLEHASFIHDEIVIEHFGQRCLNCFHHRKLWKKKLWIHLVGFDNRITIIQMKHCPVCTLPHLQCILKIINEKIRNLFFLSYFTPHE